MQSYYLGFCLPVHHLLLVLLDRRLDLHLDRLL